MFRMPASRSEYGSLSRRELLRLAGAGVVGYSMSGWLEALDRIGRYDVEVIVPGHGEPCDRGYLKEQGEIIQNWLGLIEDYVRRGLTEEEALAQPLDILKLDPYPIGQRLFPLDPWLNERNVRNIYQYVAARQAQAV